MIDWIVRHKLKFSIGLFLCVCVCQYYLLGHVNISEGVTGNIITFLSILFGFYITSLAIFVTSHYVSSLYKVMDQNKKSQTLLHTLTGNYKFGLLVTLFSLIYFVWLEIFFSGGVMTLGNKSHLPFLGFLAINFAYCFIMLGDLINIIIQEAKSRAV